MLESIARQVKTIASDAFSSVKSSIDGRGRQTTVGAAPVPDIKAAEERTVLEKGSDSLTSKVGSTARTRSVARFIKEFEAEEEKEKQEKEKSNSHEPVVEHKPRRVSQQTVGTPMQSSERSPHYRSDRSNERRALGIAEKSPPDAVKISAPMPKPQFLVGKLRPQDTLDQPRSTKSLYFEERKQKSSRPLREVAKIEQRQSQKQERYERQDTHEIRENNHERPSKRVRNGPSPMKGSSSMHAIDLDDNQDGHLVDEMSLSPELEITPVLRDTENQALVRTPSKITVNVLSKPQNGPWIQQDLSAAATSPRPKRSLPANESPDELYDDDDDNDAFTRNARQQRLKDDCIEPADVLSGTPGNMIKKHLDDMLSSPPTVREGRFQMATQPAPIRSAPGRDSASRMQRRLQAGEESPDALQGDATIAKHQQRSVTRTKQPQFTSMKHTSKKVKIADGNLSTGANALAGTAQKFPLSHYQYYNVPSGSDMGLVVDTGQGTFTLEFLEPRLGSEPVFEMPVARITKFYLCSEDTKPRIIIHDNDFHEMRRKLCFQFNTHDTRHGFCELVKTMNQSIKIIDREETWIEKVFKNNREILDAEAARNAQKAERSQNMQTGTSARTQGFSFATITSDPKKERLVDRLDAPQRMTVISGADRSGLTRTPKVSAEAREVERPQARSIADSIQPTASLGTLTRSTRSRPSKPSVFDEFDTIKESKKESEFKKLQRWKKALVYPPTGKKQETVQFDDLQRLDEDEFLNDNLVSLFIRYLEVHTNEEILTRMHVFNSFLFEALTKGVKARREINYDAVKRWTHKVDIFDRDFVVVPVNEHLHWFVMIVCNLSYFRRQNTSNADEEEDVEEENVATVQPIADGTSGWILKSDLEEAKDEASARNSFAEMTIEDRAVSTSSPPAAKSATSGRGRKKSRKSLQKYDVDKPIIITLDSLNTARSTTASVLRQYIVAEAKDKHSWDIDGNDIKGMTAKGLPHQDNFSDCGLYLCMYLEQFFLDPYAFVHKILQRTGWVGWHDHVKSSNLRKRLREMLVRLHDQQTTTHHEDGIPSLGSILVDIGEQDKANHTEGRGMNIEVSGDVQAKKYAVPQGLDEVFSTEEPVLIDSIEDWKQQVNKPIEVEDDDDSRSQVTTPDTGKTTDFRSRYFTEEKAQVDPSPGDPAHTVHSDPLALAEQLERKRSPKQTPEKRLSHKARSGSASTSYLVSADSYNIKDAIPAVSASPSRALQSSSPKSHRRAHTKFRKQDNQLSSVVQIEDEDEFQGFQIRSPTLSSQKKTERIANDRVNANGIDREREVFRDITRDTDDKRRTANEADDEPEMLV